jgi:hypothetical protein
MLEQHLATASSEKVALLVQASEGSHEADERPQGGTQRLDQPFSQRRGRKA